VSTDPLAPDPLAGPVPTAVVPVAEASHAHPPGSAAPDGGHAGAAAPARRPELLVGAAFAGGAVAAIILRRLG
jgi:hypothetical protein